MPTGVDHQGYSSGARAVPNLIRRSTSGIFRILDSHAVFPIRCDYTDIIESCVKDKAGTKTEMWTGMLSVSPTRTSFYKMYLSALEKTLVSMLDETTRKWRDELSSPQLSVFIRRLWNTILPLCGKAIEDDVSEFDKLNVHFFLSPSGSTVAEESRSTLDALTKEILLLEEEIDGWEQLRARGIHRLAEFRRMKSRFMEQLSFVALSEGYLAGGVIPEMTHWEHPEIRVKRRYINSLSEEFQEAIGSTFREPKAVGVPAGSFCFDATIMECNQDFFRFEPFFAPTDGEVIIEPCEEKFENQNVFQQPYDNPGIPSPHTKGSPARNPNRRASIDAIMAFQ